MLPKNFKTSGIGLSIQLHLHPSAYQHGRGEEVSEVFLPVVVGMIAISGVMLGVFILDRWFSQIIVWLFIALFAAAMIPVLHIIGTGIILLFK